MRLLQIPLLLFLAQIVTPHAAEIRTVLESSGEELDQVRAAFLAPEANHETFEALASHPSLLAERPVQIKIFRSLDSKDADIFKAAMQLCLAVPQATGFPMIRRRFNLSFVGPDPRRKESILELAGEKTALLKDLRLVSLLSSALTDADLKVAKIAFSLVQREPWMNELPAVAEALSRRKKGSGKSGLKLPDFPFFEEKVAPLFEIQGDDEKACVDCHKGHPILRLRPMEPDSVAEQNREHYRACLRVIDLAEPERSLLLVKPLQQAPPEGTQASGADQHGGGVRWAKGSNEYRIVLEWLQTGR